MNDDLTFVFDEDGKAHALKEGNVVASADSVEELETMMREADSAAAFSTKLEMPDAKKTQEAQALGADDDEDEDEGKEASVKESAPPMLGMGSSGHQVEGLQKQMGINADGQFGQQTQQAVMDYQKKNNLGVDGIVGPETFKSLKSDQANQTAQFDSGPEPPKTPTTPALPEMNKGLMQPLIDNPGGAAKPLPNAPEMNKGLMQPGLSNPGGAKPIPNAPGLNDAINKGKSLLGLSSTKEAKDCDCWDGYERVPGTKACEPGSCQKCDDHRKKDSATHVVTPNGLKGQILGKVKDVWGDTVTVRFENGRIVQFPVSDSRLKFASEEAEAPESPVEALRQRLAQEVEGDRRSLLSRIQELKQIKLQAADAIVKGASYEDEQELDTISIQADVEIGQVVAALDHIASEDEEYATPEPQVVEQASLGSHDGTWLDQTFAKMVNEANHTDYDQLMNEGPEAFVAELEAPALADAGVTREMASNFIRSKTAGANPEVRDAFESAWIDRVESLRRVELKTRKTRAKKEAAAENDHSNLPDDILFG